MCSLAYAVTQEAARHMLYQMFLKEVTGQFDIASRHYWDGYGGVPVRRCWTVQSTLFAHHRPMEYACRFGDINDNGNDPKAYRENASKINIRLAVRVNLGKLIGGDTMLEDEYPDA